MANNDSSTQQSVESKALLDRAERYCATAEHCPTDVEQLLFRYGASSAQTREVIDILTEHGYLDVARYSRAFVHDKVAFQAWGRVKISIGLRAKHIPDSMIRDAMEGIDESIYADNIRKLLRTRRGQDKARVMRFMLQRGYTFDDLRKYANFENDYDYESND